MSRLPVGETLLLVLFVGCVNEAETRPQTLLYINTDVPVPALADTLRIEELDQDGTVLESRIAVLPNASQWPVSLGVVSSREGTRLRLRLYGASRIAGRNPSLFTEGLDPDDPLPAFVIDRLVHIRGPDAGVRHLEVVLTGECMGVPADPIAGRTCVGGGRLDGNPEDGLTEVAEPLQAGQDSKAGSWPGERQECSGEPRAESGLHDEEVCIPGGVFFLGDERLGTNAVAGVWWASIPERLVRVSPFYLDRYEVTVGRFRAAVEAGFRPPRGHWLTAAATDGLCTYREDGRNDDLPMVCVSWDVALAFCEWDGRTLPSEAQWEYAASGRGEERMYPWGNEPPDCDRAVYARVGLYYGGRYFGGPVDDGLASFGHCQELGEGPQPVGSAELDHTRDGVMDMAGNAREWVLDQHQPLADPDPDGETCWEGPLPPDPVCHYTDEGPDVTHGCRGGSWAGPPAQMTASFRAAWSFAEAVPTRGVVWQGFSFGFRCARPSP